tara:strand:- start:290 stop:970 length:681 start_codon:yes stop_codon:yes gene_type:complete
MNKRLVGLVCWRIIMNCVYCNSPVLSGEAFKKYQKSFSEVFYGESLPINSSVFSCYNKNKFKLSHTLFKLYQVFRGESIADIASEVGACPGSVIFSISQGVANPKDYFDYVRSDDSLLNVSLNKLDKPFFELETSYFRATLNAIYEELDEYDVQLTQADILSTCKLNKDEYYRIIVDFLGIDLGSFNISLDDHIGCDLYQAFMSKPERREYEDMKREFGFPIVNEL